VTAPRPTGDALNIRTAVDCVRLSEISQRYAETRSYALELERHVGELRRIFRQRMAEWAEHCPNYSYNEDDVEQFLVEAERRATLPTTQLREKAKEILRKEKRP
jgi:hypothetical protein